MLLKRRLKLLIPVALISFLAVINYPTPVKAATLRIPVLMYHYISTPPANADPTLLDLAVTPENFQEQMQYLKDNGYHTVTPDQVYAALTQGLRLPKKPIMLTFDDGYEDAFTNAFPTLEKMGFTGTFFVVTGFLDGMKGGYLNWNQAKEMSVSGMSIEDHSQTHQAMRGRTHRWLVNEIDKTRDEIQLRTGVRPLYFCYPYGLYDFATLLELHAAGFRMAFTTQGSSWLSSNYLLTLPRVRIHGSTTLTKFASLVNWNG